MNKPIRVGLLAAKVLPRVVGAIVSLLAGWAFNTITLAQTETVLYSFGSVANDGQQPYAGLVQGSDGNFYGTTTYGGYGKGTVFKISSAGTLTTLYRFNYPSQRQEGANPQAGLVQGSDGNFYGTTSGGGTNGLGTVFKITSQGTLTTLYQFANNSTNGSEPYTGVVQGSDGNFYGTTTFGGTNTFMACGDIGYGYWGTVFKITSQGTLTTLHQFGPASGLQPEGGLVQGSDGNFYGTTYVGGTNGGGCAGTVFDITSQGTLTTLYEFGGVSTDGGQSEAGLVQGSDGNFYGTTYEGGTNGDGTVFKITPQGTLTTLWQFNGKDGLNPQAGLVQGSDGNFYGTVSGGGNTLSNSYGLGTVFSITPQGTLTTLYEFGGVSNDGDQPQAALVQGSDGNFYGMTPFGGMHGYGTVFRISIPLNPPPNQISAVQLSGTNLVFSVPSVAYETYQLQFSGSMNPTNWSNITGAFVSNGIGALLTLTNLGGAVGPQGFYRFAITP